MKLRSALRASLALALVASALAAFAQDYRVTDLGTFGGNFNMSYGFAVNDSGQVAGYSYVGSSTTPDYFLSAPNGGALKDLGPLGGYSQGLSVDDSGQVAGDYVAASGADHAFLTAPNGGARTDLGTLGGGYSHALGVNDTGQVAGYSDTPSGNFHAFLSAPNGGALTDLGVPNGATDSEAVAVNASGQALVSASVAGVQRAFLSTPNGGLTPLGAAPSGATDVNGVGLNGSAQATGDFTNVAGAQHAFLSATNGGALTDLGTLGGKDSYGKGVNDAGTVVGYSELGSSYDFHAFLYTATGGMQDLNSLLGTSSAGWELEEAWGLSESGLITGYGQIDGQTHAFLLTPISAPEPTTLAALGLGALVVLRRRRPR